MDPLHPLSRLTLVIIVLLGSPVAAQPPGVAQLRASRPTGGRASVPARLPVLAARLHHSRRPHRVRQRRTMGVWWRRSPPRATGPVMWSGPIRRWRPRSTEKPGRRGSTIAGIWWCAGSRRRWVRCCTTRRAASSCCRTCPATRRSSTSGAASTSASACRPRSGCRRPSSSRASTARPARGPARSACASGCAATGRRSTGCRRP